MSSNKPWALGWLADKEYFAELARQLDLYDGPPDNWVELQGAGIDHVLSQTGWPNIMECTIGGRVEMIFSLYVDYKRRTYPPEWIPYSQLLPQKYPERLQLVDVSYCPRFPAIENEMREQFAEAEDVYSGEYDEGYESEAFVDDEDQEYYYEVEGGSMEDGCYVEVDMPFGHAGVEGGYRADDEIKTALSEDDDSLTVRGDPEGISQKATTFDDGLKRADDIALPRNNVIAPTAVSTDASDDLSSVLRSVKS
ncbi:hypothetical protein DAEQUDRAFT_738247 [Daedalea quercina L-15889]|uniref:Uncharacterized protein n=1 Tax=Daedalea quercina L-15889 TaxID=1314783 RepID=A0A165Q7P2_9APHY|nr:hypothetical protein DAEQUDRAFT_738247 [Daedalea quercina L-15889]